MPEILNPKIIPSAKQKLESGKTKQETFEELTSEFEEDPEKIAKMIRFLPTVEKRKKYLPLNILTVVLLLGLIGVETYFLISLDKVLTGQFLVFALVGIIISIGIIRANAVFHSGAGFFGGARVLIVCLHIFKGDAPLKGMLLFELIMGVLILFLGFYLRTKLDSRYIIESEPEVIDSTGGIQFPD